jgi:hypothetical protein
MKTYFQKVICHPVVCFTLGYVIALLQVITKG